MTLLHAMISPMFAEGEVQIVGNNEFLARRLENADVQKAKDVTDNLKDFADALDNFDKPFSSLEPTMKLFAAQAPWFGVLGSVLGLVNSFLPSETSEMLQALGELAKQIDGLQTEMEGWFGKLQKDIEYSSCANQYAPYASKIRSAHKVLQAYYQNPTESNRKNFLAECGGLEASSLPCHDAVTYLAEFMNGKNPLRPECDLIDFAYGGIKESDYFRGSLHVVQKHLGAINLLIAQGIAVEAAYESMRDNDVNRGAVVSAQFEALVKATSDKWQAKLQDCYDKTLANVEFSANQWVSNNWNSFDPKVYATYETMTDRLVDLLTKNYPRELFTIITSKQDSKIGISTMKKNYVKITGVLTSKTELVMDIVMIPKSTSVQPSDTIKNLQHDCKGGFQKNMPSKDCQKKFRAATKSLNGVDVAASVYGLWTAPFYLSKKGVVSKYIFNADHMIFMGALPRRFEFIAVR